MRTIVLLVIVGAILALTVVPSAGGQWIRAFAQQPTAVDSQ